FGAAISSSEPAFAQHPALVSAIIGDGFTGSVVGIDPAGNAYIAGVGGWDVPLKKYDANGRLIGTVPLLVNAAQMVFDASGSMYVLGPTCVGGCPTTMTMFGTPDGSNRNLVFGKVSAAGDGFVWLDAIANTTANGGAAM